MFPANPEEEDDEKTHLGRSRTGRRVCRMLLHPHRTHPGERHLRGGVGGMGCGRSHGSNRRCRFGRCGDRWRVGLEGPPRQSWLRYAGCPIVLDRCRELRMRGESWLGRQHARKAALVHRVVQRQTRLERVAAVTIPRLWLRNTEQVQQMTPTCFCVCAIAAAPIKKHLM